jgi:uncharacterized protein YcbK (DUF882 family)
MAVRIKKGVSIAGISTAIVVGLMITAGVLQKYESDTVITSGTEPEANHKEHSKHWPGDALDFRIWYIEEELLPTVAEDLQDALGPDFYVRLEPDHIHISWKPRKRR